MTSAFSDRLMASGGIRDWNPLGNYKRYDYENFTRCWRTFFFDITGQLCKLQTEIQKRRFFEMQLSGMLTLRNFAGFSILMSEINIEQSEQSAV